MNSKLITKEAVCAMCIIFFIPQFKTKWISSRPGVTPAQFYEDVVLKLTEVVRSVRVDILNPINGTNIYKVRTKHFFNKLSVSNQQIEPLKIDPEVEMCGGPLFQVRPYYYNGDCFTLVVPKCLAKNGVVVGSCNTFQKLTTG